jgi:carboxymethylenebutenolidase
LRWLVSGLAALAVAPVLDAAEPPEAVIEEASETFLSHGKRVAIERFAPKEPGRYPAVLVLHGAGGIGPADSGSPLRECARRLARRGFVALIPHYFDRTGTKFNNAARNGRYYAVWMETVADAASYAGRLPQVDRRRIGLLGYSLGASVALSCGMADPRFSAVVEYAGSLVGEPPDDLSAMPPTLVLHGDADRVVPVREASRLADLFAARRGRFEMKIYPGAGHGLRGDDEADAWDRTLSFFDRHLKGPVARGRGPDAQN